MINNHSSDNSGESHIDDIVGAGFARPHHRPGIELHNGDVGVGAKNFSPRRRTDCGDNQTSFSPNFDNKTTSVARRQHTYNNLITSLFPCTDVSSLRDLMKVGDVFSTDMSSLRDLPDDDGYFVIANTMTTNHRHCEERSDEAIHKKTNLLDCFAALANFSSTESMTDTLVIANTMTTNHLDCFAALAMTDAVVFADTMTTNHRHCEERSDEAIHFWMTNAMINNHSSDNSGESHIDDMVGAGFARPHHHPGIELHNGDMGVGAKKFSPQ